MGPRPFAANAQADSWTLGAPSQRSSLGGRATSPGQDLSVTNTLDLTPRVGSPSPPAHRAGMSGLRAPRQGSRPILDSHVSVSRRLFLVKRAHRHPVPQWEILGMGTRWEAWLGLPWMAVKRATPTSRRGGTSHGSLDCSSSPRSSTTLVAVQGRAILWVGSCASVRGLEVF